MKYLFPHIFVIFHRKSVFLQCIYEGFVPSFGKDYLKDTTMNILIADSGSTKTSTQLSNFSVRTVDFFAARS